MKTIQDQVAWYQKPFSTTAPLRKDISTDVIIIGGGMAGLSAAQSFAQQNAKVVLIEKDFCGSGASGKSSGFITPDSELSLHDIAHTYGMQEAKKIWNFITSGVAFIENNIKEFSLTCAYEKQDTLVLASSARSFKKIIDKEYQIRKELGFPAQIHTQEQLPSLISSDAYYGGISYNNTFSINAFSYCQEMKKILQDMHVQIYESTPALSIQDNKVITSQATIQATNIVVCADHFTPQLIPDMKYKIYHAQTFIMLSEVLSSEQIRAIFPEKHFMAWDTDLIYHYFRLTPDNRFMIGGASLLYTYANHEKHHSHYIMHTLMQYFYKNFPQTTSIKFEYIWPGLIGISKDLFPLAGFDEHMPSVYYATAAAGLPLAAALGNYSAQHILHKKNELGAYLSPYRHFTLGKTVQKMLGTKLTFALNNFLKVSSL